MKKDTSEKKSENSVEPIVFINNQFLLKSEAKISAFDHGFLYGDGVYETLLISNFTVQDFESHYKRIQNSCKILGIEFPQSCNSSEKIQKILERLIEKNQKFLEHKNSECSGRGRLRITISRGENNFDFSSCHQATVLISLSPLPSYPEKIMKEGISLKTIPLERSYPEIKSTNFLASLLGRREIAKTSHYEAVFVTDTGFLREGTVSNIIAINIDQKIFYLAPEKTVLSGTMQAKISEILEQVGFQKKHRNFSIQEIQNENLEVYITNSLFGIIPVQKINNTILNSYTKNNQKFLAFSEIMKKF